MAKHPRGACAFCGAQTTKAAMSRHIEKCPQRLQVLEAARGDEETLLYLRVQDADVIDFWFDIEVRGSAKLKSLDTYLRAIWLECCGHLSEFSGSGARKVGVGQTSLKAFSDQPQLLHIYDFGTSSETLITLKSTRQGAPLTKNPITLLARNLMPEAICQECEAPATHLCLECAYEHDKPGLLCGEHVQSHSCDDFGEPMPLFNSPRSGMCGYDGPAKPPY